MALSIGFRDSVSFLLTFQATGVLTLTLVGLLPTEYASLRWTLQHAGLSGRTPTKRPFVSFIGRTKKLRPTHTGLIWSNVAFRASCNRAGLLSHQMPEIFLEIGPTY